MDKWGWGSPLLRIGHMMRAQRQPASSQLQGLIYASFVPEPTFNFPLPPNDSSSQLRSEMSSSPRPMDVAHVLVAGLHHPPLASRVDEGSRPPGCLRAAGRVAVAIAVDHAEAQPRGRPGDIGNVGHGPSACPRGVDPSRLRCLRHGLREEGGPEPSLRRRAVRLPRHADPAKREAVPPTALVFDAKPEPESCPGGGSGSI
jgi:hypothetical protein